MPASHPILEDLPFHLAKATLSFRRFNDRTLRSVGLDRMAPGLATALHAVEELTECTVNQLVEKTHLPNGTLTGLLDVLERNGRIQRIRNPKDGRSWLIELTDNGRELCSQLRIRHENTMRHFDETLTREESAELSRLLDKATTSMRSYLPEKQAALRSE